VAHEDDLFIARETVARGLVTREQLQDTLFEMYEQERATGGERWPLGVMFVSSGYVPEALLFSLLAERVRATRDDLTSSQAEDVDFGRLLVLTGTLTPDQVNDALAVQQAAWQPGKPSRRLGEIVVEMGVATPEQVQRVLSYQRTAVLTCGSCRRRFNATRATPRTPLKCPRCGGTLSRSRDLAFDESIRLPDAEPARPRRAAPLPAPAPPGEQAQIDRALALYLRQMSLAPAEAVREGQRIQLEMSRFGIEVALLDVMKRFGILAPAKAADLQRIDFASVVHGPGWARQTVPGYRITGKIAAGGTATIFAAQAVFGGPVAIKILHPDRANDPAAADRFRREADLLVKFDHPAIVKGIETGTAPAPKPGAPALLFLTMEHVDADALDHLLAARGALSPRHAIRITAQIAHALLYIERAGFLHRDVKPENILVDRQWLARLCDLGLAVENRYVRGGASDVTGGTAAYMSPEQAKGATDLDPGSDIYSLGMTLYAMLSGRPPFTGETADQILQARFGGGRPGAPPIDRLAAPPALQALLRRMLDADREMRIGGYQELLEALKQA